jgi:hypothetical protein
LLHSAIQRNTSTFEHIGPDCRTRRQRLNHRGKHSSERRER